MSRRSINPGFDQRIADWLEDDPDSAPGPVLETVLAAFPSIPQRHALGLPWRFRQMTLTARLATAAIAIAIVVVGGVLLLRPGGQSSVGGPSPSAGTPIPSVAALAAPSVAASARPVDYSTLGGRILMEHLGNAPDGSEMPTTDYHPERRRLYWMSPATMTGKTAVEFLPGQPSTGKLNADVSADFSKVVFMDTANPAQIWIANTDGTGLRKLTGTVCGECSELDPAFDPTGTKIVFVQLDGAFRLSQNGANGNIEVGSTARSAKLAVRDLATDKVTVFDQTSGDSANAIPEEPAWSSDGKSIVFNRTTWGADGNPKSGVLQVLDVASGSVRTLPIDSSRVPVPGDAHWSPIGSTILFSNYPVSSTGSIAGLPPGGTYTVGSDGFGLKRLNDNAGASYLSDGRIVSQNNYFWVMNADATDLRPVNMQGDDLTELNVGFAYIPHWVGVP